MPLLLLFAACSSEEEATPVTTNDSEVQSDVGVNITLTESEASAIATDIITKLTDASFETQFGEYDIVSGESFTDEQWDEIYTMQYELVAPYATQKYTDEYLLFDPEKCTTRCGTDLPVHPDYIWRPVINIASDEAFTLTGAVAPYSYAGGFDGTVSAEQVVYFIKDGGNWKVDDLGITEKDMNLTRDEVDGYLEMNGHSDFTSTYEEEIVNVEGKDDTAYIFEVPYSSSPFALVLRTGYTHYLDDGTYEGDDASYEDGEGDYSIDNEEDYLNYYLFNYWKPQIEASGENNQLYVDYYELLNGLEEDRIAAYNAGDESLMESIVGGIEQTYYDMLSIALQQVPDDQAEMIRDGDVMFEEDIQNYYDNYFPADSSRLEKLNTDAQIYLSGAYGLIVSTYY